MNREASPGWSRGAPGAESSVLGGLGSDRRERCLRKINLARTVEPRLEAARSAGQGMTRLSPRGDWAGGWDVDRSGPGLEWG